MPRLSLLVLATLFVGCGSNPRPVNLAAPVMAAEPQALNCVRTQLQQLGYTVESTTSANAVTGVRIKEAPWLLKWIGYRDTANQITATIAQDQLRVTAISADPANPAEGGLAGTGTTANRETERHAQGILNACS